MRDPFQMDDECLKKPSAELSLEVSKRLAGRRQGVAGSAEFQPGQHPRPLSTKAPWAKARDSAVEKGAPVQAGGAVDAAAEQALRHWLISGYMSHGSRSEEGSLALSLSLPVSSKPVAAAAPPLGHSSAPPPLRLAEADSSPRPQLFWLRNRGGRDYEMAALSLGGRTVRQVLSKVDYGPKSSEQGNFKFRMNLYFIRHMKVRAVITANSVRRVCPRFGLPPKWVEATLGRPVSQAVAGFRPVQRDLIVTWPTR